MSSWTIGSFSGVALVVSPFSLVLVLYLVWLFYRLLKRDGGTATPGYVLLGVGLAIFLVLLGHELAHALTAAYFGLPVTEIGLAFFGAYTDISGLEEASVLAMLLIGLSGPLYNLVTAFPIIIVSRGIRNELLSRTVEIAGIISVVVGLVNLIPTRFLDGGKVLLAIWRLVGVDPAGRLANIVDTVALTILIFLILFRPPKFLVKFIRRFKR